MCNSETKQSCGQKNNNMDFLVNESIICTVTDLNVRFVTGRWTGGECTAAVDRQNGG